MRQAISKSVRFEVFKRDGFCCAYCGAMPPEVVLEVDHITPVSAGGGNERDNLITSCRDCNRGKGARQLSSVPQSLEERAAEIEEREAQITALSKMIQEAHDRAEERIWAIAEVIHPGASEGYSREKFQSIRRFIERLGYPEAYDAARIAANRHAPGTAVCFRYFCGVCWNKIRAAEGEE